MATAEPGYNPPLGAPESATYLVQVASSGLSAEQAMGALATGLVKNAATTGVQSIAAAGTDYALPQGPRGLYLPVGLGLSTLPNDANLAEFFDDFLLSAGATTAPPGWVFGNGGTGALAAQVAASGGGLIRTTSGATAGATAALQSTVGLIANISTKKWWMAWRLTVSTAITAQTMAYVGLLNLAANKTVSMGVFGASSIVNFVLQYDGNETGSFVSTGVAIDTAAHIIEMWGLGDGKVHARIDGGTDLGATTMSSAPADSVYARSCVRNGTDNVARQLDLDWVHVLAPRN